MVVIEGGYGIGVYTTCIPGYSHEKIERSLGLTVMFLAFILTLSYQT